MKNNNIFCILAKTGGGKAEYIKKLLEDKKFTHAANLSLLVYGTTRTRRNHEIDGRDYYYYTEEEYDKIPDEDLIEYRSYYTLNDGTVFYFTKTNHIKSKNTNLICVASPYQYEHYRNWIALENLKNSDVQYSLYMIILDTDLKIRINRSLKRSRNDNDIYELCRRVIQEKGEFGDVEKRIPELLDPMISTNVCYINYNSEAGFLANIEKIKNFILRITN